MLTLILGGSGSGKSAFAEEESEKLCKSSGKKLMYIATLAYSDGDSAAKIAEHQRRRSHLDHITLECFDIDALAEAFETAGERYAVLLDSIDALLAAGLNCGTSGEDAERLVRICESIADIVIAGSKRTDVFVVSDMVFSDGTVYDELTTKFINHLGALLRDLVCAADITIEVVCGIPLKYL